MNSPRIDPSCQQTKVAKSDGQEHAPQAGCLFEEVAADQSPSEKTNVMSWILCSERFLIFWCIWEISIRTVSTGGATASAGAAEKKVSFKQRELQQ
jgi:hypothetical protein